MGRCYSTLAHAELLRRAAVRLVELDRVRVDARGPLSGAAHLHSDEAVLNAVVLAEHDLALGDLARVAVRSRGPRRARVVLRRASPRLGRRVRQIREGRVAVPPVARRRESTEEGQRGDPEVPGARGGT